MANGKYINITYPFKDSKKGFFLDLTETDNKAIKSDLLHLILTQRGQRLYMPNFGTNLLQFIFEPLDGQTLTDIKSEIQTVVKAYLPNLEINELTVEESEDNEHAAIVTLQYTVSDGVFQQTDILTITI